MKRYAWIILSVIIVSAGFLIVGAYGTNNPAVFGHTVGEIEWSGTISNLKVTSLTLNGDTRSTWPTSSGGTFSDYAWSGSKWIANGQSISCTYSVDANNYGNYYAKVENGKVYVRATGRSYGGDQYYTADSGWVQASKYMVCSKCGWPNQAFFTVTAFDDGATNSGKLVGFYSNPSYGQEGICTAVWP